MKEQTIYRSAEGKAKIITLYDEFISRLGIEHENIYVKTRYGSTHVLAIGPKDGPPMIFFHGGNSLNPFDLKKFTPLANKYRIYTLTQLVILEKVLNIVYHLKTIVMGSGQ